MRIPTGYCAARRVWIHRAGASTELYDDDLVDHISLGHWIGVPAAARSFRAPTPPHGQNEGHRPVRVIRFLIGSYRISNTSYTTLSARLSPTPTATILLIQEYLEDEVSKNGAVRR